MKQGGWPMRWFGWFRRGGRGSGDPQANVVAEDRRFRNVGARRYVRGSPYVLPKDEAEIHRLDFQHYMLRYAMQGNYLAPIGQPHDILDVGTGTGRWALEMAHAFPNANVIGIDLVEPPVDANVGKNVGKKKQPDIRPPNYTFLTANVLEGLPFPGMSFDYAHQRLLIGGVPAVRWPEVIAELVRVTRPGGWVEMGEGGTTPNGSPALRALWDWVIAACDRRGLDVRIGPKLPDMLQAAGLQAISFQKVDLPIGRYGGRLGALTETNLFSFFTNLRDLVLAYALTTAQQFDAALAAARKEVVRGRYVWPYHVVYGQRPPV
jgi:SAM-dependent methyltransferase